MNIEQMKYGLSVCVFVRSELLTGDWWRWRALELKTSSLLFTYWF